MRIGPFWYKRGLGQLDLPFGWRVNFRGIGWRDCVGKLVGRVWGATLHAGRWTFEAEAKRGDEQRRRAA